MPVTEVQKSSGTVSSIEGSATVRGTDAQVRQLAVGDEINVGDVIVTASSSSVQIDCHSEASFIVPAATEFLASEECFFFEGDASENEIASETIAAVDRTLEGERDLLEILRERGDEGPGFGDLTGDNGHTFIRLGRILLTLSEGSTSDEQELLAILEDVVGEADSAEQPSVLVSILGEYNIAEGESSGAFVVLINQSPEAVVSDITVSLNYSGVAQNGVDFNGVSSVVIPAGSNGVTFSIRTIDDALAEGAESLVISIGDITDSNFEAIAVDPAASSVENTIVDEVTPGPEDIVTISLAGPSGVVEGQATSAYTVNLSQAIPSAEDGGSDIVVTLTYTYTTAEEEDITETATVTVAAGSDSATFTIDTIDDALAEGAEDFIVSITEANVADSNFEAIAVSEIAGSVTTTITDQIGPDTPAGTDDTARVSISGEYTIIEGETSGEFMVAVDQAASDVTSDITVALLYSGVAEDGTDFTGVTEVTIAAGTNSAIFSIDTIDDALAEGSESLVISIGDIIDANFEAIAADPAASSVANVVVDETDPDAPNPPDTAFELRLFAVVQIEGTDESPEFEYVAANEIAEDGGVGTYVVIAVDENGDPLTDADQPGGTVTVNVGAGTDTADRSVDYASAATVVATVGTTFTIAAIDDVLADNGEAFTLGLGEDWSRAGEFEGVAYSGAVTTTILDETDNDPEVPEDNDSVTLSIAGPASVLEGETTTDYTLSLVDADGNAIVAETDVVVTVTYTGTATDGSDYASETPITIAAGASSATFDLQTLDDAIAENDETIVLTISTEDDGGFESLELGDAAITTVIIDDEVVPPVAVDDTAETSVDSSVVIGVTANDSDPDGSLDLGSIIITESPSNGTAIVNADGTVTYIPNDGYVGPDTFQYTIADNDGAVSNAANVAIQVSDGRETSAFTDNWVNGVQYYAYATEADYLEDGEPVAAGITGDRLDENGDPIMGSFSWAEGEFVVFKIGDVIVAEFLAEQLTGDILFIHDIAGLALSNTNADQLENTAIFLQALDADLTDGDLTDGLSTNSTSNFDEAFTNGINISEEVRDAFAGYRDPITGEPLDLQEAGKVMISDALAILGIEFTRQSEVDPNPNDEGGNENVFETQAIEHVTDTVLALADTEEAGERLADDFVFDAREEDVIVAGNGDVVYSSESLDTEDGDPESARISFNAAGLFANATPQQVAIVENMEIEIPEGTEAQITLEDGTTRVVGTVVYDDETREGYIQLEAFVEGVNGEPDRGITNAEITRGLLQSGELSFVYTLWDWTASTSVSINTLDTYRDILSLEGPSEVVEGDTTAEYTLSLTQAIPDADDGGTDVVVTLTYTYTTAEAEDIVETVSVTIPAGSSSATFTIDTVSDAFAEGREDFVVSITEANIQDDNFDIITVSDSNSVTTTIADGGEAVTLALFAVVQVEGTDESPEFEYVAANEIAEDGGVGTYVVIAVDENGDPLTDADQPGGTVTVNVGAGTDTADRSVDYASAATVVATVGTTFTIAAIDDVLADNGEAFTLGLGEDWSRAGEFEGVAYSGVVTTTILDETDNDPEVPEDNDSVTVSLGDLAVDEGAGDITITGSLDAVPDEEFVVTLDNGATITFGTDYVVGTEVESTPFSIQGDDVFVDAETFILGVTSVTSGVFEAVNIDDVSQVVISDTVDASTATLSSAIDGDEDGATVTYTVTLSTAPTVDETFTFDVDGVERTITLLQGQTTGTTTVAYADADVFIDVERVGIASNFAASDVDGASNYESLTLTNNADGETLEDTTDATTLTLNDVTVSESDDGEATITASLDKAPATELVVTLDNGATITFGTDYVVGTDVESTAFAINNDEDVYVDGSSVELSVSSTSGGNFENLVTTDTSTVTVNDTIDATTVTLESSDVNEGADITITASVDVDNAPQTDLVVTLSNGETLTIDAGETSGSVTFTNPNADDAYVDGETLTYAITGTTGGNYESLNTASTVDVVVSDTIAPTDATTLTLNDVTVSESDDGEATITASLDKAPATELVVTLDNGATITFGTDYVVGTDVESTAFAINNDEDVYVDGSSVELSVSSTSGGNFENLVTTDTSTVTVNDTIDATTVTLESSDVNEGADITITASVDVDNAPQTDLVVTLSNGETLTIDAGETSGSVTFTNPNADDAYVDGETLTYAITGTTGGNYESLNTASTVDVVVSDTIAPTDATTLTLNDVTVSESDDGEATITASLDKAPATELVVTLDNGATITFGTDYVVGTDVESTAFAINNDEDVYVDGSSVELSVSSTSGGNFENLVTTDTSTVTVNDTIDATTVTLESSDVNEGADITITASVDVDNAPQTDLVVTLSNGETLTIDAGETSGSVTFTNPNADDAYVDGETLTYAITGTTGGNYESLNTASTVDVVVSDTIAPTDATTLTLNDVTVSESDDGEATITASLDKAPATELVVTLDNGATITFGTDYVVGTDVESTAFAINNDEDVYVDGSSVELSVSSTSGGNFENLVTTDTSTVTVNDTIDATTVTLESSDVNEGADITITASVDVDNAPQTDLVVTLSNGETLTIDAGETSGSVTFTNPNADDAYVDGETLTYAITGTTGGNYESLNTASTVDVVVSDTIAPTDATTLTLNDVTVSESDDGEATITASLDKAPATELVVTLDNGATITFGTDYVVGTDVESTAFAINNDEDVYVDGSSVELSVSSTSGGNFENLVTTDTSTVTVNDTIDATTVTLESSDVNEGADITITASVDVDNAPQTDLVVTLSNGETLTIDAGETSGSVTFTNPNADDAYVDGETLTYAITGTTGGNYESLNTASTVDVVVSDTIAPTDATTLTLNDVTVSESDDGEATITASLDKAPATELVVTLDNGATITFGTDYVVGTDVESTAFAINNDEDVYVDGSSVELSVSSTSGGNFENLVTTDTSTVTVNDTIDATTVTLESSDVNEGADITITASVDVDNAPQTDLVVTLSNGETLTIDAGETSGSVTFTNPNADDAYVDGETLTYAITGTTGGNYESLNTASTVDVVVSDTIAPTDATTLTLNDVTVSESDDGEATITASLDKAPATELVVTLDNGATITFGTDYVVGTDVESTAFAINNDEDVYVDGSSVELSVSSTSGGNFENLVTTDTSTVTVNDTIDATTVTLESSDVNEGADITITASVDVDNAPQTDLVVTLSNGETLTIDAGETSGSVTFTNPNADDAYVDGETLTYAITGTTGGNYESLNTASTVDVVVSDTIAPTDATTLTLNDVTVSESDDGEATITASLDKAPATELVVTLDNGATITFGTDYVVGTDVESTAFAINNDEDVYVDGSSVELSVSSTSGGNFENLVTTDTSTVTVNDTIDATTVTLESSDVNEGADITITASVDVDNAPQTDLVVTLSNGETLTIDAGETSGSVTFTNPNADDAYVDGETLTYAITGTTGGNYESLNTASTVDVVVSDTIAPTDATTLTLNDVTVSESDDGEATITASLDKAPATELVVTLDNGATITFGTDYVVGTDVESTAFAINNDEDVYVDGSSVELSVSSTSGGNFENLVTTDTSTVTVNDTIDATTVTLESSDVNEGADITITASVDVDNAPQTDLVVTLSNGETLTIDAGETSGSVTFTNPNADDAYVDGETLTYAITGTTGGNYESLNTASTVDVVVSDTIAPTDATTLTLNDVTVSESDDGEATITASLDKAPATELVVTLDNGATITFGTDYVVGTDVESTAFAINNDEDVYVDGSSVELSVSSTSGGNFENLVTTDTSTVTVNDTIDATTVTLESSDVNEGADITITASVDVDNAPQTDLVVTLSNGETLTIDAGETSGSVTFTNPNADDAYVDGETLTYAITGTTGGNYESLNTASTVDVVVSDTIAPTDATTLTLNDVTVSESDDGEATITASLDKAPATELVVTLDNGATITFGTDYVVGTDVESTAFAINNDEDVYVDGSSVELSVSSTSGGNFENLVTTDTSTVTVNDTIDATTVTLESSDVNEGADITITASVDVDNAPQTDLVVTLSNGETLTIDAGETSGSVTFTNPNADDAYVDGETLTYAITGTTGGNYESLNTASTVDVVVSDTIAPTDATTLTLNDVTVSESDDGEATITASLDKAPATELVVTLDNGATITFGTDYVVGTDVESTAFAINNDEDVYVDGSSVELSVSSTSGGNFENLVTTDTSTVTVNDTIDATTVTLESSDVNEGADITITASVDVDNAPQTDLVVTLSNGETLTIDAGETSGSVTFTNPNADDAYVDGETLTYAITGTTGGNYESLNTASTVDVVVSDTIAPTDATTLTLNDVTVSESDDGEATITASLDKAPATELVVTLDNGATITFGTDYVVGTDVESTAFAINNDEDVYVDGSSVELSVSSTSGGNFENLVTTDTSTVTVNDTIDATTVTLESSDVNEGADITITASVDVDNAPQTDLVVTLSNGETLTIDAGETSGSVTFTNPNADDAYVDGETLTYAITGTTGGNYESLNTASTVDVVVSDTIAPTDATTLTLNDVTVSESDDGEATITASLDKAPATELVVTLDNGATITFGTDYVVGTDVESTAFAINNDEDVYVDGSSVELSVSSTSGGNFENLVTTDTSTVTVNDTIDATTVTLESSDVNEGADITITASVDVDNAPQTDLVVTLSNGETLTIDAGETSGSVTFTNPNADDAYVDGETLTYAITGTTGGNYESLNTASTVDVVVSDTIAPTDATTLTLNDVTVSESDDGEATITASLDKAPATELVVTLDNGATITFGTDYVVGTDVESTAFAINNDEDVYVDGSSVELSVSSTSGGNFENLVTTDTSTVTVNDTIDATTVTLESSDVNEGADITITASVDVDNAPQTDLVVTLSNGETLTIDAGETSGSVTFTNPNADDAYVDGETLTYAITGTTGGNYESLNTASTVDVVVSDTIAPTDATTLTLNDVTVSESDDGEATITASLDKAPATELVVTLDNGATITFGTDYVVGTDVESTAFAINNDEDVYVDGSSVELSVSSTSGGNFENLVTTDTSTVTVNDTIDATTVTLESSDVNEGADITITASVDVDNAPQTDLVVTLSNGETLTIDAGETSGSVTFTNPNADDAYVDGETLTYAITGTTGGNYESLNTASTVDVVVSDTIAPTDATTLTLNDVTVSESDDGEATITASLDKAPATELVVTLDNGATITFGTDYVVGTDVESTAFAINNDEDVYVDGSSVELSVSSTSGGNFENLVTTDTSTVTVNDTIDATTVTLESSDVNEGADITITASVDVDNAPQTDLVVTLSNGETLTIDAGETSGSVTFTNPNADDAYVDGETLTYAITGTTGGNYESLNTASTVDVVVSDTIAPTDATTLTLNDVTVSESDDGEATITASLDKAPATELVVTLDNGATITFGTDYVVGTDVESTAFAINNDEDVYVDGSSVELSVSSTSGGNFENLVTTDTSTVTVNDTIDATTVTLESSDVNEGADITITASVDVDNAPQTDLVVTLSNGETLTIDAGETSGSVTFTNPNADDAYVDGETLTYAITGTTGGNYESLNTASTVDVVVSDTIAPTDATTLTLNDVTVSESDDGEATITASLDKAPATELVVTLDNGATITFGTDYVVGTDVESTAFAINNDEDVYVDGSSVELSVSSTSGGNFENLVTTDTSTVTVNDTIDATTVTLESSDVNEGADITITASVDVDNAPQTDLVVTLSNGETLTIDAGETSGSVTFTNPNADDAYVDGETLTYAITGTTGGNYESLNTASTVDVVVSDTIAPTDATTLTLNDVTVSESDDGEATITASLDKAPATELVVTLDNGATITFGTDYVVGTDVESTAFAINNDEDVYVDGSSVELSVSSTSGGNFENLVTTDTSTVTVNDTIDATTVTLTAEAVDDDAHSDDDDDDSHSDDDDDDAQSDDDDDDDAQSDDDDDDDAQSDDDDDSDDDDQSDDDEVTIRVTAEVDNAPETDLTMTLSTGETITILANQTVASVEVTTTEDALPISIVSTTGGNYESLNTDDTAILSTPLSAAISHAVFRAVADDGHELIVKVGLWEAGVTDATAPIAEYAAVEAYLASQNIVATVQSHVVVAGAYASEGGIFLEDGSLVESEDIAGSWFASAWNGESFGNALVDYRVGFANLPDAPVAIDLDGDGVEYLSVDQGVTFEDQGSGKTTKTAWVAGDDGILVIDANNSGTVDETSEYVFTEWSDDAQTDLEAIAQAFDTNQDGVLDAQDERFDQFAVWQDRDSDGVTDEGELTSLTDLGIESIELGYRSDSEGRVEGDGDVTVFGQANVNYQDGSTTTAEDASFAVEAADLLSEDGDLLELLSDGGEEPVLSRAEATQVDIAQLELTLNFEHNESDSFDQNE